MFYLLNDNSIIDSENLPKNVKIERIAKDDKGNAFLIQIQYLDFLETRKIGYVKKQSENVYDLIEKGDLVNTIVDSIYQVVIIVKNTIIAPQWAFDLAVVNAIYKPDEKGNYIKVWEKKEGEQ